MSKISKEEAARLQGAWWTVEKIEAVGLDETKKDLRWRGAEGIPLQINEKDRKQYLDSVIQHVFNSFVVLALSAAQDEFSLGKEDLRRFMARFERKAECINDGFVEWGEIEETLAEEVGVTVVDGKIVL